MGDWRKQFDYPPDVEMAARRYAGLGIPGMTGVCSVCGCARTSSAHRRANCAERNRAAFGQKKPG